MSVWWMGAGSYFGSSPSVAGNWMRKDDGKRPMRRTTAGNTSSGMIQSTQISSSKLSAPMTFSCANIGTVQRSKIATTTSHFKISMVRVLNKRMSGQRTSPNLTTSSSRRLRISSSSRRTSSAAPLSPSSPASTSVLSSTAISSVISILSTKSSVSLARVSGCLKRIAVVERMWIIVRRVLQIVYIVTFFPLTVVRFRDTIMMRPHYGLLDFLFLTWTFLLL